MSRLRRGLGTRRACRPLLGLPTTVKEQYNLASLPTTWGDPQFHDWQPQEDALPVARLKAAGAIVLGRTIVPLGLMDWQSENAIWGTTNNPWNLARTPGGSAAALAAGFVTLDLASGIGGSLRCPAHFCGVYAHKPSLDLVPSRGAGPPATPAVPVRGDLAVLGPMARSAGDLALALDVLARTRGPRASATVSHCRRRATTRLADYRVRLLDAHPLCPTAASVAAPLDRLGERLSGIGCRVARYSTALPDLAQTTRNYVELVTAFNPVSPSPEERERPLVSSLQKLLF